MNALHRPHLNASRPSAFRAGLVWAGLDSWRRSRRAIRPDRSRSSFDQRSACTFGTWRSFRARACVRAKRSDEVPRDKDSGHRAFLSERVVRRESRNIRRQSSVERPTTIGRGAGMVRDRRGDATRGRRSEGNGAIGNEAAAGGRSDQMCREWEKVAPRLRRVRRGRQGLYSLWYALSTPLRTGARRSTARATRPAAF